MLKKFLRTENFQQPWKIDKKQFIKGNGLLLLAAMILSFVKRIKPAIKSGNRWWPWIIKEYVSASREK